MPEKIQKNKPSNASLQNYALKSAMLMTKTNFSLEIISKHKKYKESKVYNCYIKALV